MEAEQDDKELTKIETKSSNIFLGTLLENTKDNYKIITKD